jgi:2-methylisocitrate lyase-like PEP mutase family enzyme
MPCCWDALSARLIERAGFPLTFMSGFAVSAAKLALPDTQLISYAEMLEVGRALCAAVEIPVIGDADTGYGNALNVKRTIAGYAQAGFAAAMIEDQLAPKRCGHFEGKAIVELPEATERVRITAEWRRSHDTVVIARTDALAVAGLAEAIERGQAFVEAGADVVFVEAIESVGQLAAIASALPSTPLVYNAVEGGRSPLLDRARSLGPACASCSTP